MGLLQVWKQHQSLCRNHDYCDPLLECHYIGRANDPGRKLRSTVKEPPLASFIDESKRTWEINITIGMIKRVLKLLKVDLLELDKGTPPLLTRLSTDLMLLVDVIWVLIMDQAALVNVTDEEFGMALNGPAVGAAQEAFYEELVLFFQGLGRKHLAVAVQTQTKIINQAVELAAEKMQEIDLTKHLKAAFGNLSTGLQAQSESTPIP